MILREDLSKSQIRSVLFHFNFYSSMFGKMFQILVRYYLVEIQNNAAINYYFKTKVISPFGVIIVFDHNFLKKELWVCLL